MVERKGTKVILKGEGGKPTCRCSASIRVLLQRGANPMAASQSALWSVDRQSTDDSSSQHGHFPGLSPIRRLAISFTGTCAGTILWFCEQAPSGVRPKKEHPICHSSFALAGDQTQSLHHLIASFQTDSPACPGGTVL